MTDIDVCGVNIDFGIIMLTDGDIVDVVSMFDIDGDECGPELAQSLVAGPDSRGKWWAVVLSDFSDSVSIH